MAERYVESDDNKKMIRMDATNSYGHSMSQLLPYDEIEMWHGHPDLYMDKLGEVLETPDDNVVGYFIEVDPKYPDNIKKKTKNFPFAPENKILDKNKHNHYMKKIHPKKHTKSEKLKCDWTEKRKYLIQ